MQAVLIKALGFVIIIVVAYSMKQMKMLKKEDGYSIATIIMNVTLPCALITNSSGVTLNSAMILLLVLGIVYNSCFVFVGYLCSRNYEPARKAAYVINSAGLNIGNFAMPFIQSFFPGAGIAYLCMFDIGNSIMIFGGTYATALSIGSTNQKISIKYVLKRLFSSIPFDVYIMIFFMSLFHIRFPDSVLQITSMIGGANAFLAMFMIGLILDLHMDLTERKDIFKILSIRFFVALFLSLITYFVLPIPKVAKIIMIMALFAPASTVAPIFSRQCGYQKAMPAALNSISIILGVLMMVILLIIFV